MMFVVRVDKYVLFTFAPPTIPLIYVPDHNLNSNSESGHLSLIPAMNVHGIAKCTINNKSAKLIAIHNIPLPHTHIIIYCNELNSNVIVSVNVNKS